MSDLDRGVSEVKVQFYGSGGHNHDGVNSTIIDYNSLPKDLLDQIKALLAKAQGSALNHITAQGIIVPGGGVLSGVTVGDPGSVDGNGQLHLVAGYSSQIGVGVYVDVSFLTPPASIANPNVVGANVIGYTVEYVIGAGPFGGTMEVTRPVDPPGTTVTIRVSGLQDNTTYGFRVQSRSSLGQPSFYLPKTGYTSITTTGDPTPPADVAGFTAIAGVTTAQLSWNRNTEKYFQAGTGAYEVQVASDTAFTYLLANGDPTTHSAIIDTTVSALTTTVTNLNANGTYYARIKAKSPSGILSVHWAPLNSGADGYLTFQTGGLAVPPGTQIGLNQVSGNLQLPYEQSFEAFNASDWNDRATSGANSAIVTGAGVTGGNVFRATGQVWWAWKYNIPYDPAKLYKISARVRNVTASNPAGNNQIFIGVEGIATDGVTLINAIGTNTSNSQHYVAAAGVSPAAGGTSGAFTVYTGYFSGNSATVAPSSDPNTPATLYTGVKYFRPLFLLNYIGGNGVADIDNLSIEELGYKVPTLQLVGTINAAVLPVTNIPGANINIGTITSAQLGTGSVLAAQLAANAVTTAAIAANAVTTAAIAANAVTTATIAANAITAAQIANNAVTSAAIATGAITSTQIAANAITTPAISAGSITTATIAAGAITTATLAAGAVTATNIAANTITASQIAANTIGAGQIVAGSITSTEIAANTITASDIAANTITANQIAANTITANQIAANTITANQIAANTITAGQILANTITANQIAANTITANQIAANTITAGQILANTITANEIAANTITAGQILANTITAGQIAAHTITAGEIFANTIDTGQLKANAVNATILAAGAVSARNIAAGAITTQALSVVALSNNLIPNGSFEDAAFDIGGGSPAGGAGNGTQADAWSYNWLGAATGSATVQVDNTAADAQDGVKCLTITCPSTTSGTSAASAAIPAAAGNLFLFGIYYKASVSLSYGVYIKIYGGTTPNFAVGDAGVQTTTVINNTSATTSWFLQQFQTTIPSGWTGVKYVRFVVQALNPSAAATVYFDLVSLYTAVDGTIIKPNSISTGHLATGTLSASNITAGTLNAGVIYGGTISAGNITAGSIQSTLGFATGGQFIAGTAGAARVVLDSTGIRAYNGSNAQTFGLDASSGTGSFTGSIQSGSTITGTTIQGGTVTGALVQTVVNGYSGTLGYIKMDTSAGSNQIQFLYGGGYYGPTGANGLAGYISLNESVYMPNNTYGSSMKFAGAGANLSRIEMYENGETVIDSPGGVTIQGGTVTIAGSGYTKFNTGISTTIVSGNLYRSGNSGYVYINTDSLSVQDCFSVFEAGLYVYVSALYSAQNVTVGSRRGFYNNSTEWGAVVPASTFTGFSSLLGGVVRNNATTVIATVMNNNTSQNVIVSYGRLGG